MKNEIHGIPNHHRATVVLAIYYPLYSHISSENKFFTDGSSINGCTGFGVYSDQHNNFRKLNEPYSLYVAEQVAKHCALGIIESLPAENYFVFSDSLSSIQAKSSR